MKKNNIIADSSGIFSLFIAEDSNHQRAKKLAKRIIKNSSTIIIPADVLSEVVNILGKKINHQIAYEVALKLIAGDPFQLAESTVEIRDRALNLFKNISKKVSFTDCLVMAFADEYKTKIIFGFDQSFSQNNYQNP
jgi:predicted nucleic acid-binding protein